MAETDGDTVTGFRVSNVVCPSDPAIKELTLTPDYEISESDAEDNGWAAGSAVSPGRRTLARTNP